MTTSVCDKSGSEAASPPVTEFARRVGARTVRAPTGCCAQAVSEDEVSGASVGGVAGVVSSVRTAARRRRLGGQSGDWRRRAARRLR